MSNHTKATLSLGGFLLLLGVLSLLVSWRSASLPVAPPGNVLATIPRTPDEVPVNGNFGYSPDPAGTERFLKTLPAQTLRQAAPKLFEASGDKEAVLLYRALYEAHQERFGRPFVVANQGIGDCVSHGWGHALDISLAVEKKLGNVDAWLPSATESIYGGSRVEARGKPEGSGGYRDGSYGGAAARWVRDWGVVYRQVYPEEDGGHDLLTYSPQRAKSWGNWGNGGQGDNGRLDSRAKDHPVVRVALATNFVEAAAAVANGYPVAVCSGQGFTSTRDADGFCRPSGSWSHCMAFVGVRYDRRGLLCLNSWGPSWVRGPKWPADMPDGSFWVDANICDRMLRGRDSFAASGPKGFEPRKLKNSDGW